MYTTTTLFFSSSYHHQSVLAECSVHTVKNIMKKCHETGTPWCLGLLEYLCTPIDDKTPSPSSLISESYKISFLNLSFRLFTRNTIHTRGRGCSTKHEPILSPVSVEIVTQEHEKSSFTCDQLSQIFITIWSPWDSVIVQYVITNTQPMTVSRRLRHAY